MDSQFLFKCFKGIFVSECALIFLFISGLPIQVRDQALNIKDEMPKSDVNKEYYSQNIEREVSK